MYHAHFQLYVYIISLHGLQLKSPYVAYTGCTGMIELILTPPSGHLWFALIFFLWLKLLLNIFNTTPQYHHKQWSRKQRKGRKPTKNIDLHTSKYQCASRTHKGRKKKNYLNFSCDRKLIIEKQEVRIVRIVHGEELRLVSHMYLLTSNTFWQLMCNNTLLTCNCVTLFMGYLVILYILWIFICKCHPNSPLCSMNIIPTLTSFVC